MSGVEEQLAAADPEQRRLMAECCILIDEDDNIVGHETKKNCHLNTNIYGPRNLLHRAFSVFIFDKEHRLLMQQRSDAKITFPAYWANTCCSHPLYVDDEVKGVEGAITAARRKMEQELGIPPEDVPPDSFRFVSRVHYKARSDDVWGEHEIDYILLCQPPGDVRVSPNANEVQNTGWFTPDELRAFIEQSNKTGDLISPWFRAIEAYRLHHWWQAAARGDVKTLEADTETIHRVDASAALHCDGVGAEGTVGGDASRKQGAYGLVPTHKHSAFSVLAYPAELFAALRYKLGGGLGGGPVSAPAGADPALVDAFSFCDTILVSVSRSFASVIHQLDPPMRRAICVFYLALRALDTVEDDTAVQHEPKRVALRAFWRKLDDVDFTVHGVGKGDERRLLENMPFLARAFRSLPGREAAVIRDITRLMGRGMAEFVGADLRQGTDDVAQYNRYCHHVAGLVGEGLSKLFTASGAEAASVAADLPRANHMGLFLQKTNIIRDYLEDLVEGRAFWPRSVWSKYGDSLGALAEAGNREQAVACLDELVADALGHAPHSLAYLDQLRSPSVFKFCAIPQLMAIATLYECLHEPRVFTGVIKMRKTLAVQMITDCSDMRAVRRWFALYARRIAAKAQSSAAREALLDAAGATLHACGPQGNPRAVLWGSFSAALTTAASTAVIAAAGTHLTTGPRLESALPESARPARSSRVDVPVAGAAVAAASHLVCALWAAAGSEVDDRAAEAAAALGRDETPRAVYKLEDVVTSVNDKAAAGSIDDEDDPGVWARLAPDAVQAK